MKPTKLFRQLLIPNKTIVCLSSPNQPKRVALVTHIGTSSLEYLFLKKGRFARGFAPFSCTCIEILSADQGRSGLWLHYYLHKIFSATVTNEEILDDCLLPRFKRLFTVKQLARLYLQAKDKRVRELALFAISKTSKKGQHVLRRLCRTLPVIDLIDLTYIYESCRTTADFANPLS